MHDLVAITALGGTEPKIDRVGSVTCTETPGVALASVAARLGREDKTRNAVSQVIGAETPAVGQFTGGPIIAFWTGPEQWMIEAPFETHEDLAHLVKERTGDNASVSEQTDAWVRFDLDGDGVLEVLELLSNLDCRKMAAGAASRTSIHHLGCFVLCRASGSFSVYGPRSSAGSLHHAIVAAMKSAL